MAEKGYTLTRTVPAAPKQVFATLTDLAGAKDWVPGLLNVREIDDKPLGTGKVWIQTRRHASGKATVATVRVTKHEPGEALGLTLTDGAIQQTVDVTLAPNGLGTDVTWKADVRRKGALFFLAAGARKGLQEEDQQTLEKLAERLASRREGGDKAGKGKAVVQLKEKAEKPAKASVSVAARGTRKKR